MELQKDAKNTQPTASSDKLGMRQLNGVYTQAFNRCHQRVGHVFQGRYKAILVEKDSHLLELCRYVVLNPVRAGMITKPDEWKWSSYKSTAYVNKVPEYLIIYWVLGQFADKKKKRSRVRSDIRGGRRSIASLQILNRQTDHGATSWLSKRTSPMGIC